MVNIQEKDGIFILDGENFDLKIDNNRIVYVKKKGDKHFNSIDVKLDVGYTSEEKKRYLYNFYIALKERNQETKL